MYCICLFAVHYIEKSIKAEWISAMTKQFVCHVRFIYHDTFPLCGSNKTVNSDIFKKKHEDLTLLSIIVFIMFLMEEIWEMREIWYYLYRFSPDSCVPLPFSWPQSLLTPTHWANSSTSVTLVGIRHIQSFSHGHSSDFKIQMIYQCMYANNRKSN